jgi:hypothetical protein
MAAMFADKPGPISLYAGPAAVAPTGVTPD